MKKKTILALMTLSIVLPAGCGSAEEGQIIYPSAITITEDPSGAEQAGMKQSEGAQKEQNTGTQNADEADSQAQNSGTQSPKKPNSQTQNSDNPESQSNIETEFDFGALSDRVFYFSSGAGAWYTEVFIDSDGSFSGHYQDADMGSTGENYPYGTLYYCEFSGSFGDLEKVNAYTYKINMNSLTFSQEPETQEIIDGVLNIYSTAYGLDNGEVFYLYLPGTKFADLPEEYRSWVHNFNPDGTVNSELLFYGLYNINAGTGFSSSIYEKQIPSD